MLPVLFALIVGAHAAPQAGCLYESQAPNCQNDTPDDGYWWWGQWWVPGMIDVESWYRQQPPWAVGRAVYYSPGVMEATAAYRELSLEEYQDGVALIPCSEIGETVWLRRPGKPWEGPYLVVDCARRGDAWPIFHYRHEVVEVGWRTWVRWGEAGPLDGVEVLKWDPARWPPEGEPIDAAAWWLERATFGTERERKPLDLGGRCWRYGGPSAPRRICYQETLHPLWEDERRYLHRFESVP